MDNIVPIRVIEETKEGPVDRTKEVFSDEQMKKWDKIEIQRLDEEKEKILNRGFPVEEKQMEKKEGERDNLFKMIGRAFSDLLWN